MKRTREATRKERADEAMAESLSVKLEPESASELSEARLLITSLRSQLSRALNQQDSNDRELAAARGESERARSQLSAIRRSRSWRLVRPLRFIQRSIRADIPS